MNSTPENAAESKLPLPIWRHGFRPFFFFGCLYAAVAIALWWGYSHGLFQLNVYGGGYWWHAHEMTFGFSVAIVYGFLLTAVQNWTGVRGSYGVELASLFLLWLGARIFKFIPVFEFWSIYPDIAFMVLGIVLFARPLLQSRQLKNFFIFVPLLLAMTLCNALSYKALSENQNFTPFIHAAIFIVIFMMVLMASRVVPFFIGNAFGIPQPRPPLVVEWGGILTMLTLIGIALAGFHRVPGWIAVVVSSLALFFQCVKILYWFDRRIFNKCLLWSLFSAYAFIPVGLVLIVLYAVNITANFSLVLHAFTVGGLGGLVLAMAARVSLGHTGRKMVLPRGMSIALGLIFVGGLLRVLLPLFGGTYYSVSVSLASLSWSIAFIVFTVAYFPVLFSPRVDGKPG